MQPETIQLIEQLVANWDKAKANQDAISTNIHWENPNVVWVYTTENQEDYEGSQEQFGIDRSGLVKWEYQSHCSCYGYENSTEEGEDTLKSFSLEGVPPDFEQAVRDNIAALLK